MANCCVCKEEIPEEKIQVYHLDIKPPESDSEPEKVLAQFIYAYNKDHVECKAKVDQYANKIGLNLFKQGLRQIFIESFRNLKKGGFRKDKKGRIPGLLQLDKKLLSKKVITVFLPSLKIKVNARCLKDVDNKIKDDFSIWQIDFV